MEGNEKSIGRGEDKERRCGVIQAREGVVCALQAGSSLGQRPVDVALELSVSRKVFPPAKTPAVDSSSTRLSFPQAYTLPAGFAAGGEPSPCQRDRCGPFRNGPHLSSSRTSRGAYLDPFSNFRIVFGNLYHEEFLRGAYRTFEKFRAFDRWFDKK